MDVKVVIPARLGSSRLPGKPLLKILGKPIVLHVVERCKEAGIDNSNIFVATDDKAVLFSLKNAGTQVVMTSPTHQSGTERINEVAQINKWSPDTIVLNVQGDEPMIPPSLIQSVASFAAANSHFDITTAVVKIDTEEEFSNPNVVKAILGQEGRAIYFTRSKAPVNRDLSHDLSLAKRHIGIYSYRVSALQKFCFYGEDALENYEKLEQLRALSHGMSIGATVYSGNVPHGVDTLKDFEEIKKLMEDKVQ
mgnify:CR=1 FL=1